MAFIGNTPTTQAFTPAIDYFSGNGSTTAFTLSRPVASVAQVQVTIDNVAQNPSSAYTVSGSTITFTSAPLSGTNNIYVYYTSPITQVIAPGQGTVGATALDVYGSSGTGAENLPSGTTAQRPSSPVAGANRFNSTLGFAEYWTGSQWATYGAISATSVSYLVVAGGGGSAGASGGGGGGGGAGGFLTGTASISLATTYTVTVGAGGAGGATGQGGATGDGTNGSDSVFSTITSTGGGGGGAAGVSNRAGKTGGSGGGGGAYSPGGAGGAGNTPSTSPSQGNNGGAAVSTYDGGGGGGGASAVGGSTPSVAVGGAGGAGTASSISGSSVTYAGGGGGASSTTGGAGGAGGGGTGGGYPTQNATAGTANTGGGGGSNYGISGVAKAGGSGVVIIAYPTTNKLATATGTYTQTISGGNYIFTFTSSGTITF